MKNIKLYITILSGIIVFLLTEIIIFESQKLDSEEIDFFFGLITSFMHFFYIVFLLIVSITVVVLQRKTKNKGFFIPIVILFVGLFIIALVKFNFYKRENSPIQLFAHYFGDINALNIKLRKNNTYKIEEMAFFGGTYYFGKYTISSDTIFLNKKEPLGPNRDILNDTLLILDGYVVSERDSLGHFKAKSRFRMKIIDNNLPSSQHPNQTDTYNN